MKIVILDWDTMTSGGDISPEKFNLLGDVTVYGLTSPEQTAERIADADAVLCNKVLITGEIMDKCPNLKYIGLFATGFNNIDVDAAAARNITVCNSGRYSTNAVAQQVFAYILDHYSRIRQYDDAVRRGEWTSSPTFSYFPFPTGEIAGKTIAIVGYGSIGSRVAQLASAFGMEVIVCTRTYHDDLPYEQTDLISAASRADILTVHCPLTAETKGLADAKLFGVMKSSAVFINTSRGPVVNENDLADALRSGSIAAAYTDVLSSEPMPEDHPLKGIDNCIITPHTAWAAYETRVRLNSIVYDCLEAWSKGSPINKVN